jgi:hypothetical protein
MPYFPALAFASQFSTMTACRSGRVIVRTTTSVVHHETMRAAAG